ncbi:trehalose-6-phosphate synthase, partial [Klebsiella pneumoniae]|nr:trehalose-6-phosphate synthase [Klebsiella pneumoniae]
LMHIYRHSDICWISSLRDGMNLVAKEYIAAQDPENPGVLILSKYAGAAEQMSQALIVDPQDRAAMMDALKMALEMSKAERINRYQ